jgi:hypothetical protein
MPKDLVKVKGTAREVPTHGLSFPAGYIRFARLANPRTWQVFFYGPFPFFFLCRFSVPRHRS